MERAIRILHTAPRERTDRDLIILDGLFRESVGLSSLAQPVRRKVLRDGRLRHMATNELVLPSEDAFMLVLSGRFLRETKAPRLWSVAEVLPVSVPAPVPAKDSVEDEDGEGNEETKENDGETDIVANVTGALASLPSGLKTVSNGRVSAPACGNERFSMVSTNFLPGMELPLPPSSLFVSWFGAASGSNEGGRVGGPRTSTQSATGTGVAGAEDGTTGIASPGDAERDTTDDDYAESRKTTVVIRALEPSTTLVISRAAVVQLIAHHIRAVASSLYQPPLAKAPAQGSGYQGGRGLARGKVAQTTPLLPEAVLGRFKVVRCSAGTNLLKEGVMPCGIYLFLGNSCQVMKEMPQIEVLKVNKRGERKK